VEVVRLSIHCLHFDHILLFSKVGTSVLVENILFLCARHNLQKLDTLILFRFLLDRVSRPVVRLVTLKKLDRNLNMSVSGNRGV
jgi:hypothetical protein